MLRSSYVQFLKKYKVIILLECLTALLEYLDLFLQALCSKGGGGGSHGLPVSTAYEPSLTTFWDDF